MYFVRILSAIALFLSSLDLSIAQSGSYSATSPCVSGCCNGEYCAECGPYTPSDSYNCPLNVAAVNTDFVGQHQTSVVQDVLLGSLLLMSHHVQEARVMHNSSYTRPCDAWAPENITDGVWTQLNYAFPLIDSDYTISQMNSFDAELYPRFTNLKSSTSGLKVFISVGGWPAGGKIFSDMVGSAGNRATFIASALQFMETFSFDGIDIDWEYPAASDRDGVAADTANFVTFLKELKTACSSNIGDDVTTNPSYTISKLAATTSQNSVSQLTDWSDCMAVFKCNDSFQLETTGHGKVYNADTNAYVADGCHGGSNGFNRAFWVESNVSLISCDCHRH
ncbi:glycoside hydrolase [Acephala macrosclerotiorum]|nr:glycoside hydrolase [Acephala macrosclerotiorum]